MFNNYILGHEIKIHEVIESVQDYDSLGQKIGACPDIMKKKNQEKNKNGTECFW